MYQASTGVFLRKTHFKPVDHDSDSYCVDGLLDFSVCASDGAGETGDLDENTNNHDDDNHGKCQRREMREVLLLCMEEQETILNEDGDVSEKYFALFSLRKYLGKLFCYLYFCVVCGIFLGNIFVQL